MPLRPPGFATKKRIRFAELIHDRTYTLCQRRFSSCWVNGSESGIDSADANAALLAVMLGEIKGAAATRGQVGQPFRVGDDTAGVRKPRRHAAAAGARFRRISRDGMPDPSIGRGHIPRRAAGAEQPAQRETVGRASRRSLEPGWPSWISDIIRSSITCGRRHRSAMTEQIMAVARS
jgi:hypothetical protein